MPGSDLYLPTDPAGGAEDDSSSPWTRPWFLASAGFLALLALAALAVIIFGGGAGPDPSPSGPAQAAPGAECPDPPDGQDPAVPVQPPAAYWRLVGSAATPVSSSAGPWVTDKGHPARCFAHTPTGALFAAVHVLAGTTDPDLISETLTARTAPGPGRDVLLQALATDPTSVVGTGGRWQVTGYTFLSYTPDQASLALAIGATGGQGQLPVQMLWSGSDWQLVIPPDGDLAGQMSSIGSTVGFTPWGGA